MHMYFIGRVVLKHSKHQLGRTQRRKPPGQVGIECRSFGSLTPHTELTKDTVAEKGCRLWGALPFNNAFPDQVHPGSRPKVDPEKGPFIC